jgi:hypothetical protein
MSTPQLNRPEWDARPAAMRGWGHAIVRKPGWLAHVGAEAL